MKETPRQQGLDFHMDFADQAIPLPDQKPPEISELTDNPEIEPVAWEPNEVSEFFRRAKAGEHLADINKDINNRKQKPAA